jgi:hypothetical protein
MNILGFEILIAINIKIAVAWGVTQYDLVDRLQHFERTYTLHF